MFQRTELAAGPRVISARLPGSRSVSIAAYVLAGSRLEAADQAGVAHFMEHLTFKGTAGYPSSRAISEADIVQLDEPYMQARPQEARAYGLKALNRALEGIGGTTAVHICFGYAAIIHERPSGYSFLPELSQCSCTQVSIETAQSRLDCSVLSGLANKKILLGVLDLSDMTPETPEQVAARIRRALPHVAPQNVIVAPDVIGGLRVQVGPDVIDSTVFARLADARRQLAS